MKTPEVLALKEAIRRRDGYRCVDCGERQQKWANRGGQRRWKKLHVHRIQADGPYSFENCKTLCPSCHCKYRRDYTGELPPRPKRWIKQGIVFSFLEHKGWTAEQLADFFGESARERFYQTYDGLRFYPNEKEGKAIIALCEATPELQVLS